jgi:hypothetical protein
MGLPANCCQWAWSTRNPLSGRSLESRLVTRSRIVVSTHETPARGREPTRRGQAAVPHSQSTSPSLNLSRRDKLANFPQTPLRPRKTVNHGPSRSDPTLSRPVNAASQHNRQRFSDLLSGSQSARSAPPASHTHRLRAELPTPLLRLVEPFGPLRFAVLLR